MLAIVIPYYKIRFFETTLESLSNQSDKRFKVYIGDDCSPDDCSVLLEKYIEKIDFVYYRFEENLGNISLTKQWERCIALSVDEEWLMLLGDDDVLSNNLVEAFYKFIELNINKVELIRFNLRVIDQDGKFKSEVFKHEMHETTEDLLDQMLMMKETITASEFVFSREVYNKNNGFVEFPLAWFSDYATWLNFSKNTGVFFIKEADVYWRLSDCNISAILSNEQNIKLKVSSLFRFMYFLQLHFEISRKKSKAYTHAQLINFFGNISDFVKFNILRKELFKFKYRFADIIIFEFVFRRIKRKKIKNLWKYLYRI